MDDSSETLQVKTYQKKHNCSRAFKNRKRSVKFMAEFYGNRIRKNPQWKLKDMQDEIKRKFQLDITICKCSRIRSRALSNVWDLLVEHYKKIWDYATELFKSNKNNTIDVFPHRSNPTNQPYLQRFYVCLHALKRGWLEGCRPIIGLDGCFLKTAVGGQLISAVGRDGNNQIYPIAWAIVETENTDSWRWFIKLLVEDLEGGDGSGWTVVSDQQKGLKVAIDELLPFAEHRNCSRHIYANFRKKFSSLALRKAFWATSMSTYEAEFKRNMKEVNRLNKDAHDKLQELNPKVWSKAFLRLYANQMWWRIIYQNALTLGL